MNDLTITTPEPRADIAVTAQAQMARTAIEARYQMAVARPRDLLDVRDRLLADARRPGFAAVAIWSRPQGGKTLSGTSIRFAEAAIRAMRNIHIESHTISDDADLRVVRVVATDLEANVSLDSDISVSKTVERRQLRGNQVPIAQRENSYGDTVFIVPATDDEVAVRQAALTSKAIRTLALRLVPGDIVEEALAMCRATLAREDAADPDAARRKMCDAYSELGVRPSMLAEYLGCAVEAANPAQLAELRGAYVAIRDGELTWAQAMESRRGRTEDASTPAAERVRRATRAASPEQHDTRSNPGTGEPDA